MKHKMKLLLLSVLFACIVSSCSENATDTQTDVQPTMTSVVIYLPDDNAEYFTAEQVEVDADADLAQQLIAALVAHDALPQGCEMLSWNEETGELSMNTVYADAVGTTGTAGENMLIYSIVNTFFKNFTIKSLTLSIEGNVLETGHAIYDSPFEGQAYIAQT